VRSVLLAIVTKKTVTKIVKQNVHKDARLMTDTASYYRHGVGIEQHETVNHGIKEYVRGDVHTNTVEGYFSIFKRGMRASISIATRSTCTAISRSLISATTTASRWA
jgi:hypothetical protein